MTKSRGKRQAQSKKQKATPTKKLKSATTSIGGKHKKSTKGPKHYKGRTDRAETSRASIRKGKRIMRDRDSSTDNSGENESFSDEDAALRILKKHREFKGKLPGLGSPSKKEVICKLIYTLLEGHVPGLAAENQPPINNFGDVEIHSRTTYYRSNLKTAAKSLQSLTFKSEHLEAIKKTPFWILFNSLYTTDMKKINRRCHKYEEDIRCVLKSYHMNTESFLIGGDVKKITKTDVQLIFGVIGGTLPIPLFKRNYKIPEWIRRCFEYSEEDVGTAGKYQLYKSYLFEALKYAITLNTEESYRDVGRLVHCYLLGVLLAPSKNGSLMWHITCYCEEYEEIYKYDWGDFVCNMLMDQIKSSERLRAGGCTMLLLYLLCEMTNLIKPVEDQTIPRYLKWDLKNLNKKLQDKDLSLLDSRYVRQNELKQTEYEKETYQRLKISLDNEFNLAGPTRDESCQLTEGVTPTSNNTLAQEGSGNSASDADEEISNTANLGGDNITGDPKIDEPTHKGDPVKPKSSLIEQDVQDKQQSREESDDELRLNQLDDLCVEPTEDEVLSNEEHVSNTLNAEVDRLALYEEGMNKEDRDDSQVKEDKNHSTDDLGIGHCEHINRSVKIARSILDSMTNSGADQYYQGDKTNLDDRGLLLEKSNQVYTRGSTFKDKQFFPLNETRKTLGSTVDEDGQPILGSFDTTPSILEVLQDTGLSQLNLKVIDLESKLEGKDNELKTMKEKLRACTNQMEATRKSLPQLIKQKVEEALQKQMSNWDAYFGSHLQAQQEVIGKLNEENRRLVDLLNAELNPTDSQFVAKEYNLKLWDTFSELKITKGEKEELLKKHKQLMDRVQKIERLNNAVDKGQHEDRIQGGNQQDIVQDEQMIFCEKDNNHSANGADLTELGTGDIEGHTGSDVDATTQQEKEMRQDNNMVSCGAEEVNTKNLDTLTEACVGEFGPGCTPYNNAVPDTDIAFEKPTENEAFGEPKESTSNLDPLTRDCAGDLNDKCTSGNNSTDDSHNSNGDTKIKRPQKRRVYNMRSSMIERVKNRTENEDRKAIEISPQLNTRDLIDLDTHYIGDKTRKKKKAKIGQKLILNERCGAVKNIGETTIAALEKFWNSEHESAVVWKGVRDYHNNILLSDILRILHDERISNSVVDGWGELILKQYGKLKGDCQTLIFGSSTWDLIYNRYNTNDLTLLKTSVDNRLEDEVLHDYILLFPMLTSGRGRHDKGDHWTLMKFEVENGKWYFYNSLAPRSNKVIDCHLSRAKELVEYVEEKLRTVFQEKYPSNALIKGRVNRPIVANCPQQEPESLDCGVVVCEVIEQVVGKCQILYGSYSYEQSSNYRSKMVNSFINLDDATD